MIGQEERRRRRWRRAARVLPVVIGIGWTVFGAGSVTAQVDTAEPADTLEPPSPAAWPCRDDELSRRFDFWIGEWAVFANGERAGTNVIEPMLGGCVLLENWTNVRGRAGKSFNWVDRSSFRTPRWRQLWVADQGNTLDYYDGGWEDGAMRFRGHTFTPEGDSIPQKLAFVPVHADTVRQIFEQSNDGGESWVVTWEGLYVRLPLSSPR